MGFTVYQTRDPLIDVLIAMGSGRAQADRQNSLIRAQNQQRRNAQLSNQIARGAQGALSNFAASKRQQAAFNARADQQSIASIGMNQAELAGFAAANQMSVPEARDFLSIQQQRQAISLDSEANRRQLFDKIRRFDQDEVNKLLGGDSGTGEQLFPNNLAPFAPSSDFLGDDIDFGPQQPEALAQQKQQDVVQYVTQNMGLVQGFSEKSIKEIVRLQDYMQEAINDQSLSPDEKLQVADQLREQILSYKPGFKKPQPPPYEQIPGFDAFTTPEGKIVNLRQQVPLPKEYRPGEGPGDIFERDGHLFTKDDRGMPKLLVQSAKSKSRGSKVKELTPEKKRDAAIRRIQSRRGGSDNTPISARDIVDEIALMEMETRAIRQNEIQRLVDSGGTPDIDDMFHGLTIFKDGRALRWNDDAGGFELANLAR